jgi:prevent-host-death family protein
MGYWNIWRFQYLKSDYLKREKKVMADGLRKLIKEGGDEEREKMVLLNITDARKVLREVVDRVVHENERIALSRYGKPAAVLVSVEDAELLEILEDKADLEVVRKVLKNPKPIPWDKAKAQLGL